MNLYYGEWNICYALQKERIDGVVARIQERFARGELKKDAQKLLFDADVRDYFAEMDRMHALVLSRSSADMPVAGLTDALEPVPGLEVVTLTRLLHEDEQNNSFSDYL